MLLEWLIKIVLILFATVVYLRFVFWIYPKQIDLKKTFLASLQKTVNKSTEWIATIEPNAIYQNGKVVGNVTKDIEEINGKIVFHEICDTSGLNNGLPFEYKREKFKIIKIGKIRMNKINVILTDKGVKQDEKHNVIEDVICERIK